MKKMLLVVFVSMLAVAFVACDDDSDDNDDTVVSISQDELAEGVCELLNDCDSVYYSALKCADGTDGFKTTALAGCDVYDGESAAGCLESASSMSCEDAETLLASQGAGNKHCESMCN